MIIYKNGKEIDTNDTTRRQPDKEEIKDILESLSDSDLLYIHNEINDYYTIYTSDEFDDICGHMTPTEQANKTFYGNFNPNHNYWIFNGYENFESSDYLTDFVDLDELADYIIDNETTFDIDELQEYFDNLEEDEEE